MDTRQHPEWRQFLIRAALKRAGELERLRDLPAGAPVVVPAEAPDRLPLQSGLSDQGPGAATAPATDGHSQGSGVVPKDDMKTAGLPSLHIDADADAEDITGSINDNPGATMPMDIGETSSTELPIAPADETPPVTNMPMLQTPEVQTPDVNIEPPSRPAITEEIKRPAPRRIVHKRWRSRPAPPPAEPARAPMPPPFNILEAIFRGLADPQGRIAPTAKAVAAPPAGKTSATPANVLQASGTRAVIQ
ncbi:MAG: hypothetical protein WC670_01485 [Pseudolabrys sp.]